MARLSFETVRVKTDAIGGHQDISSVEEALEFLRRGDWPKKDENFRLRALVACLEAVLDTASVAKARDELVAMVKRADLLSARTARSPMTGTTAISKLAH